MRSPEEAVLLVSLLASLSLFSSRPLESAIFRPNGMSSMPSGGGGGGGGGGGLTILRINKFDLTVLTIILIGS